MKMMYIDCGMGAAGDMLTGALLELLPEAERESFVREFNSLGIPGVVMETEASEKLGVHGTKVRILVNGHEEGGHLHDGHHHVHNGPRDIGHIVNDHISLPDKVRRDILEVYRLIAEAESKAHGVPVTEIHFHEVGQMDAVADVTAVCMLMDRLSPDRVTASPVNTGGGTVKCAHGVLQVPAPATANLLEGIPSYADDIKSELCTPTGAALLGYFASEFGEMPVMKAAKTGHGMGTKDFVRPNCLTVTLGETMKL